MVQYTELRRANYQHGLVYGVSKSGKSTFVSQLARKYKLIWLSCDGGHTVIDDLPVEAQQNIDVIWTPDTKEAPFAFDTCRKLMNGTACEVCAKHGIVNCTTCKNAGGLITRYCFNENPLTTIVIVDHLTQITTSCLNVVTKGKADDYKPERDDWGSLYYHMGALLSTFQNAQFHVIALAQVEEAEQDDKSKKIGPSVGSSKFTKNVGQYFDHVIYTRIRNKSHEVGSSTTYEASIITGSRARIAIEDMKQPTMLPFFDRIPQLEPSAEQKVEAAETKAILVGAQTQVVAVQEQPKPSAAELLARLKTGKVG